MRHCQGKNFRRFVSFVFLGVIFFTHVAQGIGPRGFRFIETLDRMVHTRLASSWRDPFTRNPLKNPSPVRPTQKKSSHPLFIATCLGATATASYCFPNEAQATGKGSVPLGPLQDEAARIQKWYETKNHCDLLKQKEATRVVFLGNTGSGKTTTIAALLGFTLKKETDNTTGNTIISIDPAGTQEKPHVPVPGIGNDPVASHTDCLEFFELIYGSKKTVVVDTPGMKDTHGPLHDAITQTCLVDLFSLPKKSKLVVVVSYDELTAVKGREFKDFCETFASLVRPEIKDSILWVCTKYDKRTKNQVLKSIESYSGFLRRIWDNWLAEQRKDTLPPEDPQQLRIWQKAKNHRDRVAIVESIGDKNLFLLDPMDPNSITDLKKAIEGDTIPSTKENLFFINGNEILKFEFLGISDRLVRQGGELVFRRALYSDLLAYLQKHPHTKGVPDEVINEKIREVGEKITTAEQREGKNTYVYNTTVSEKRNSWGGQLVSWSVIQFEYDGQYGLFLDPPEETILKGKGRFNRSQYDLTKGIYRSTFSGGLGSDVKVRVRLKKKEGVSPYTTFLENEKDFIERYSTSLKSNTKLTDQEERERLVKKLSEELSEVDKALIAKTNLYEALRALRETLGIQSDFDVVLTEILQTQKKLTSNVILKSKL